MKVVEARVHGLVVEHKTQQNVVILRELDGLRILPIWIGPAEAAAIRRLLAGEAFPRPLTHDLLQAVVEGLKAKVTRVVISELRENTFYAHVIVERDAELLSVDARPSDAIAVALRAKAPLWVNETLLQEPPAEGAESGSGEGGAGEPPGGEPRELTEAEKAEQLRRFLEKLDPEDFGKFQM